MIKDFFAELFGDFIFKFIDKTLKAKVLTTDPDYDKNLAKFALNFSDNF